MAGRDPISILDSARRAALRYAQHTNQTALSALLKRAQLDLNKRLHGIPASDKSFTSMQMRTTLKQIEAVTDMVKRGLLSTVVTAGNVVAEHAAKSTIDYLKLAEKRFAGVSTEGLGINTAMVMDTAVSGANSSVLRRIMTDPTHPGHKGVLQRYGESVVGHFENTIQASFVAGTPWDDIKAQLVESSPFLQQAPAYYAERIVRTEVMGSFNASSHAGMNEINDQTGGEMIRILCATFDDRTGSDSLAYHGQVRRMTEPFTSWTGSYMTPPNRPNDREIVVPHHIDWPLPPELKEKPWSMVLARWRMEGRKGAPPPRPLMSTIPMGQIGHPEPKAAPVPPPEAVQTQPVAPAPEGLPYVGRRGTPQGTPRTQEDRGSWAEQRSAQIDRAQSRADRARAREQARSEREIAASPELSRIRDQARNELAIQAFGSETRTRTSAELSTIQDRALEVLAEAARIPASTGTPVSDADRVPVTDAQLKKWKKSRDIRTDATAQQLNEYSQKIFERPFDVRDFDALTQAHLIPEANRGKGTIMLGSDGKSLSMNQYINSGTDVEKLQRTYNRTRDGKLEVQHHYFVLPKDMRHGGIGPQIIEGQFHTYKKLGVDRVETHAAWDGQYVWPSMGFKLMDQARLGEYQQEFCRWAQGDRRVVDDIGHGLPTPALPKPVETRELLEAMKAVHSIQDLALLQIGGIKVGRDFLRQRGFGSGGLINVEMHLKDEAQWKLMEDYYTKKATERAAKLAAKK